MAKSNLIRIEDQTIKRLKQAHSDLHGLSMVKLASVLLEKALDDLEKDGELNITIKIK